MTRSSLSIRLAVLLLLISTSPLTAYAEDIYVRAGAEKGKGTRERPYRGIYKALDRARPGDVIHVAAGDYSGKLGAGFLNIRTRNLTLRGGYTSDFAERQPFANPTRIFRDPAAQSDSFDNGLIHTEGDVSGLVIDGFVLDATGRNVYESDGDLDIALSMTKPPITLDQADCHLRYCIVLNTAGPAVRVSGPNASVEHCLIVNAVQTGIDVHGRHAAEAVASDTPILIRHNTILFTWKWRGTGGAALTIGSYCSVLAESNLFGFQQGVAISNVRNFDGPVSHQLLDNAFFQNRDGLYAFFSRAHNQNLTIESPTELEEADLAQADGNRLLDPLLRQPAGWFEQFIAATTAEGTGRLHVDGLRQLRERIGLPIDGEPDVRRSFAPAFPLAHVLNGDLWRRNESEMDGPGPQIVSILPIRHPDEGQSAALLSVDEVLADPRRHLDRPLRIEARITSGSAGESIHTARRVVLLQDVTGEGSLTGFALLGTPTAGEIDQKLGRSASSEHSIRRAIHGVLHQEDDRWVFEITALGK